MITAHIASLPSRIDGLEKTIKSLLPQVDRIFVALNGYESAPDFLKNIKIDYVMLDNSLGDAAKFFFISRARGYALICDDDLVYPEGYALYMIEGVNRYAGIVSLLGKVYGSRPISSFKSGYTEIYRCLTRVLLDKQVDVGGTGAMAFHVDLIELGIIDFPIPNMADIWLAKVAHERGVSIHVLAHPAKYVKHHKYSWCIWSHMGGGDYQTKVLNSFLK